MTDYTKLISALRYHADATIRDCDGCPYQTVHKKNGMCIDNMVNDAADAIEELQAQMPKRGEWIRHGTDEDEFCYYECPLCGFIGIDWNYCPNCGAKMDGAE